MNLFRRIAYLLRRRQLDQELQAEMAAHREAMGEPQQFGNTLRLRDEARDAWGWIWLDQLQQDVHHGLRVLAKRPVYAATAIFVLSLGIGLNMTLIQVLNAAAWKPLNIRDPHSLVRFFRLGPQSSSSGVPYPVAQYVARHNTVLEDVITLQQSRMAWGDGEGQPASLAFVSANFFEQLGGVPAMGRPFRRGEEPGAPVVVVSHQFWSSRLRSDPATIGSTVTVNGRKAQLIGVAAEGFHGPTNSRCDGWLMVEQIKHFFPGSDIDSNWRTNSVNMYARLKPGVSAKAAEDGVLPAIRELAQRYPDWFSKDEWLGAALGTKHFRNERGDRELQTVTFLLGGLSLLVLIIACANVAGLGVAQATSRLHEFRMRAALGAGRGRVVRQWLTEAALLAMGGVAGGWFTGYVLAKTIMVLTEFDTPMQLTPDWRTALAALLIAFVTALAVGLAPALRVTRMNSIAAGLRDHGSTSVGTRSQRTLLAVQVMGTSVLLVITALTARKLDRLVSGDFGFVMEGLAVIEAPLGTHGYTAEAGRQYWMQAASAMKADPRVAETALSSLAPLGRMLAESDYRDAPGLKATHISVEPEFFQLMRIPLIRGRNFNRGDTHRTAVIIGQRLAERMYGTLNVLGKSFPRTNPESTIIGVAANATLIKIQATNVTEIYHPLEPREMGHAVLLARMRDGVALTVPASIMRQIDGRIVPELRWMTTDLERRLFAPRLMWQASQGVGTFALLLSAVGIFGLVAYTVSLRTREIGVRVALGAGARSIVLLLLRGLMLPIGAGAITGLLLATLALGGVLSGEPLYLDPHEPIAAASAASALACAVLIAAAGPLRRALRIDPVTALRQD
ncbi:MAG: ABC transporter permease [Bryobacterales bacterium]|nr:ABC transporter permease [Bryobacterales bacterium]